MAVTGIERSIQQLRLYGQGFYDGAAAAQVEVAKEILELAKYYCPVDTGDLRSTGRLDIELRELQSASVDIQFGGPDSIAPYAVYVHERLDLRHAPPTQAKFLEQAVNDLSNEFTLRVGEGGVNAGAQRAGLR